MCVTLPVMKGGLLGSKEDDRRRNLFSAAHASERHRNGQCKQALLGRHGGGARLWVLARILPS